MSGQVLDAPTPQEVEQAGSSRRELSRHIEAGQGLRLRIPDNGKAGGEVVLPAGVVSLLNFILEQLEQGYSVRVFPVGAELSTQQAADFLNVSRPYLIKQIEAGHLSCHMVGSHRRIKLHDLIEYKKQVDQTRLDALEELARLNEEFGEDD